MEGKAKIRESNFIFCMITFGPRSLRHRQLCVDRGGTGFHPSIPSWFAVFGQTTQKQTKLLHTSTKYGMQD